MTGSKLQRKPVHALVYFCISDVKATICNHFKYLFFREKEMDEKLKQLRIVLQKLPTENYNNLRYVIEFQL